MGSEKTQALEKGKKEDTERYVIIPHDRLSPETLTAVIEEYVTREGTDYGETEVPFDRQVMRVKQHLEAGKAYIIFNNESQTCSIVSKDHFNGI